MSIDRPFVIIGERINPTGRKVLAAEMKEGRMDRVRADAIAQAAAGAHMLDVNAGIPQLDEAALLVAAIKAVSEVSDAPICIDSSIIEALEAGLAAYEGKALVNSVTAEEERMERILPLVKKHGAAVIGMANDETGISMVPEERLALARRIIERAADYGIPQSDVIIDPIAMTVAADPTCGVITLETMRLIRDQLGNNMTCGASNVSFGLPDRATVNAAFLPLAMHAGLTCAITNPLVPEVRRAVLAGDLLLGHDEYAMRWIASFRAEVAQQAARQGAAPA
ncbi:MAG TPA: dihydropteroate synthase [Stellaceae bacterium]|nr:dihydropteroate synthase [Stellaceae bacterium]